MNVRRAVCLRVVRVMAYHGLIKHPYGREHAQERFTRFGGVSA